MTNKKIVVVGSSNTDMIIKVSRIPRPGETIMGGRFSMAAGGKGANQAVAAARAGGNVVFIGKLGRDLFGEQAIRGLAEDRIDTSGILRDEHNPSGIALISVDEHGENSIAVASGANGNLLPDDLAGFADVICSAKILLMQLEIPLETVSILASLAHEKGVEVILNPAPARGLPAELLKCLSILTPNESEAQLLTGVAVHDEEAANQAAEVLRAGGVNTILITLGARGAFHAKADRRCIIPTFKVEPVDTTAAGDVFSGSLVVGLAEGKRIEDAVRFANAAAALSVMKMGAQPSIPYREEIDTFLAAHT
jgi:ribokinase